VKKIIVIHDFPDYALSTAEFFGDLSLPTKGISTATEASRYIEGDLSEVNCIIIHKDIGQYSGEKYRGREFGWSDEIIKRIHDKNPAIRIGVVSGEFPDGDKHILRTGADFYIPNEALWPKNVGWVIKQIGRGPLTPNEIGKRGKFVEKFPDSPGSIEGSSRNTIS